MCESHFWRHACQRPPPRGFFTCSITGKNPGSRGSGSKYLLTAITARANQGDRTLQVWAAALHV